jgi:hypothetical protein
MTVLVVYQAVDAAQDKNVIRKLEEEFKAKRLIGNAWIFTSPTENANSIFVALQFYEATVLAVDLNNTKAIVTNLDLRQFGL